MMALRLPVAILAVACVLLGQRVTAEESFYSGEYSQEMLRKLESEIFAKTSPLQPMDYLMLYVIELKQGMTVLNDTVSKIGREYHDMWRQEIDDVERNNNNVQCESNSSNSEELRELHLKMDAMREDVQRVLEEVRSLKNAPAPTSLTVSSTAKPDEAASSQRMKEAGEAVKNYTGHSNWRNVKRSLEYVLEPSSAAYQQLEAIGSQDTTPLKSAAEKGYTELLEVLLDEGLPVDTLADDIWRFDLLSAAAMSGQVLVVELLLARGAQTEVTNNRGVTPLMFAASKNHLAVVKALVEHGADINHRNYDGNTALDLARKRNNLQVVQYLSRHITTPFEALEAE